MKFAGIELTQETILLTRQHFAGIYEKCIESAVEYHSMPVEELSAGQFFVNDLTGYLAQQRALIAETIAGQHDVNFTFLQRAHSLQTGDCIALLL